MVVKKPDDLPAAVTELAAQNDALSQRVDALENRPAGADTSELAQRIEALERRPTTGDETAGTRLNNVEKALEELRSDIAARGSETVAANRSDAPAGFYSAEEIEWLINKYFHDEVLQRRAELDAEAKRNPKPVEELAAGEGRADQPARPAAF